VRDIAFTNYRSLEITEGSLSFLTSVLENHGTILGIGTLKLDDATTLVNEGIVAPGLSPDRLTINVDFSNGPNGSIDIELASATVFDVLAITGGTAALGGTLRVRLLDGFVPAPGAAFNFLTFSSASGSFDRMLLDGYSGAQFALTCGASSCHVGFADIGTPEPVPLSPTFWPLASGFAAVLQQGDVLDRQQVRSLIIVKLVRPCSVEHLIESTYR